MFVLKASRGVAAGISMIMTMEDNVKIKLKNISSMASKSVNIGKIRTSSQPY